MLLFGFSRDRRNARLAVGRSLGAADHRDAAGADQLGDAEGPHHVDEGLDLSLHGEEGFKL